jgi:hypothetical protein
VPPEASTNPAEAFTALVAQLRGEFVGTLGADAGAVGTELQWEQAAPFLLERTRFGAGGNELTRWLRARNVTAAGVAASAASLYNALARALFGAGSAHGPKLRWLAVEHMRRNEGAFAAEASPKYVSFSRMLAAHRRTSEPGTLGTLRALACCLGVVVRVIKYSSSGQVSFVQVAPALPSADGSGGSADAAPPTVYLCAPMPAGLNKHAAYDVLLPLPAPPTPVSAKRKSSDARELAPAAAARKIAAAPAGAAAGADEPLAALAEEEEQESESESDDENDGPAALVAKRLVSEMGGGVGALDEHAWAAALARDDTRAVNTLLDGVRAMLNAYRSGPQRAGQHVRAEALRAVDAAVEEASKKLDEAEQEAQALADAHTVLVVGAEGAGKSSMVNRIALHVLAPSATLARINAGAAARAKADAEGIIVESTRWDDVSCGKANNEEWFTDAAAVRDTALDETAAEKYELNAGDDLCPTGGSDTTTAMCTTVVLAPGLQPRLVLKYKRGAALREVRSHLEELRAYPWAGAAAMPAKAAKGEATHAGAGAGGEEEEEEAEATSSGPAGAASEPPSEPKDFSYWADYAAAVFGKNLSTADAPVKTGGYPPHVLVVSKLTDEQLELPTSFRALLGTTRTLRFTHTDRDELVLAVSRQLVRHTLGHWSHWGLLESARLYLPTDDGGVTLTLMDVPGYGALLPYRKSVQDAAFERGGFSTLLHCIKPRTDEKTIPERMRKDTKFVAHVLCPLMQEDNAVDFSVVPLYSIDHCITSQPSARKNLRTAWLQTKDIAELGTTATQTYWLTGLQNYLEDIDAAASSKTSDKMDPVHVRRHHAHAGECHAHAVRCRAGAVRRRPARHGAGAGAVVPPSVPPHRSGHDGARARRRAPLGQRRTHARAHAPDG